jgi:hypothetical protein
MSTFANVESKRLTELIHRVRNISIDALRLSQARAQNTDASVQFLTELVTHAFQLTHSAELLSDYLGSYLDAVQLLRQGKLSSFLIPPDLLTRMLAEVAAILREHFGAKLSIIHDNTQFYYGHAEFYYIRTGTHILLTILFPLTNHQDKIDYYQIHAYHLPLQQNTLHTMTVKGLPDGVAVSQSGHWIAGMTRDELRDTVDGSRPGATGRIFTHRQKDNCLTAIFEGNPSAVNETCKYTVHTETLQASVKPFHGHTYVLTAISHYTLTCTTANDQVTVTKHDGCISCLLTVPQNCDYDDDKHHIFASVTQDNTTVKLSQHILNFALLSRFFEDEKIQK